jgi:hypothetical protein
MDYFNSHLFCLCCPVKLVQNHHLIEWHTRLARKTRIEVLNMLKHEGTSVVRTDCSKDALDSGSRLGQFASVLKSDSATSLSSCN